MKYRVLMAWAILLALLLVTRFTALNQYLIVDESDRWLWTEDFTYALVAGDLSGTLIGHGYPGVFPAWISSLWTLLEAGRRSWVEGGWIGEPGLYALFHQWDRTAYLFQQRLPIVMLNSALALGVIGIAGRLFGLPVALVGGVLIALDPFYLSDSRVNRAEAVITGLMTLSILMLLFYQRDRRNIFLIGSGVFAGLACLTKIQGLILAPIVGLLILWIYRADLRQHYQRVVLPGLLWGVVVCLTWTLVWPAMWVVPGEVFREAFDYATHMAASDGAYIFFMGHTYAKADPGVMFYPVVFLMRTTPLVLLGLVVYLFAAARKSAPQGSGLLLLYIVAYTALMTFGNHKQDRYLLPIFLAVNLLAGIGLVAAWGWLTQRIPRLTAPDARAVAFGGLVAVMLITIAPHHPYYYSYFNPLLGGGQTAVHWLRVGWGEGMDRVAAYLNEKPNSDELVVSTRFTHNMLHFRGERLSLSGDGRWTQSDYIVLYIQQVQRRQDPSPGFFDYFDTLTPEKTIRIGGIDYAKIYPRPMTTPADPNLSFIPGQLALLGYRWDDAAPQETASLVTTRAASTEFPLLRVLWENRGLTSDDPRLMVRLVGDGTQPLWTSCQPDPRFAAQAETPGGYVESLCAPIVQPLTPGYYSLAFALHDDNSTPIPFPNGRQAVRITEAGQVVETPPLERLDRLADLALPAGASRLDRIYDGRLRLVASELTPARPQPGDTVTVILYWQPLEDVSRLHVPSSNAFSWATDGWQPVDRPTVHPIRLTVQLADSRLIELGRDDIEPPTATWIPGEVATTTHTVTLPADLGDPLAAQLEVSLFNEAQVAVSITTPDGAPLDKVAQRFTIASEAAWQHRYTPHRESWQHGLTLRGYDIPDAIQPGDVLPIHLYFEATTPITASYAVFVHLLDAADDIRAQRDSLPLAGAYPTVWWEPNRVVGDTYLLDLPADVPTGAYRVRLGFYLPDTGARLTRTNGADSITLPEIILVDN